MKNILLFILSATSGFLGLVLVMQLGSPHDNPSLISPQRSPLTKSAFSIENPPSDSLQGKIISMSGKINWQSRTATAPAALASPVPITQGERLTTEASGALSVKFGELVSVIISPQSDLTFAQTLPANIVIDQSKGLADYSVLGASPLSVRSLHLLTNQNQPAAEFSILVNTDQTRVTVRSIKGQLTVAYNDSQNISQVVTVAAGEQFIFNDDIRQGVLR